MISVTQGDAPSELRDVAVGMDRPLEAVETCERLLEAVGTHPLEAVGTPGSNHSHLNVELL